MKHALAEQLRCCQCQEPLDSLEAVISLAVREGKRAYEDLAGQIDAGMARLQQAKQKMHPWVATSKAQAGGEAGRLALEFNQLVDERHQEVKQLMQRQRQALETFNIALFGRTGAGKSTLMETFSRGQGEAVSHGESDWTTEVRPVDWNQCRLYDTPGIGGWGRNQSRSSLEAEARKAVEVADVVVLCFDSQSQQAGEFEKVADWVQRYGKPVIAVLNCRNPRWRMPTLVKLAAARRNLSQSVVEHTGSIRDELEAIGLTGVPIVAISAKRALFARASEPFLGKDRESFESLRAQHGTKALLGWSNFAALEGLLVSGIRRDAAGLRLGMLGEQVRGVLSQVHDQVKDLDEVTNEQSEIMENTIAQLLKVVGYPALAGDARGAFKDPRVRRDLLTALEDLRGEPFKAPVAGEFQAYLRHTLEATMGPLRRKALSDSNAAISDAFDRREKLSSEAFGQKVFREAEMKQAAESVMTDAVQFLHRKTSLALKDAKTDFACLVDDVKAIKGGAGRWLKALGYATNLAGIASGLMGALALANFWNPLSLAVGAAAAFSAVATFIFGWLGDKAKQKAEASRLTERRRAIADAEQVVHKAFDRLGAQLTQECDRIAGQALSQLLVEPVRMALVLRLLGNECQATQGHLGAMLAGLQVRPSGSVFSDAAQGLEHSIYPGDPAAGRKLWMGESWIAEGLDPDDALAAVVPAATQTGPDEMLIAHFREAISAAVAGPSPGAGAHWLAQARSLLRNDPAAEMVLSELDALTASKKPRLTFCGDYNAGKSSFIKRILLALGRPVPEGLEIKARPTTSRTTEYDAGDFLLVDIPGFQSSRTADTRLALQSCPDATLLLFLFQPNLLMGEAAYLEQLLLGGETGVAKLARTVFVINRVDELGSDPLTEPEEFDRRCRSKRQELLQALGSRQVRVSERRVFCMASDPYGLVGDSRDEEVQGFAWDGFAELLAALETIDWRNGVDISVLEGGSTRLLTLATEADEEAARVEAQQEALDRLDGMLAGAIEEAERIAGDLRGRLGKLVDERASGLLQDVFTAVNAAELDAQAKQLSHWWDDEAFQGALDRWQTQAQEEVDEWVKRTQESIARRLRSAEFRKAFPSIESAFDGTRLGKQVSVAGKMVQLAGNLIKEGSTRDLIYSIGKAIGAKFKPYGAINAAKNVSKAGAALAFVGVVLDTAFLIKGFFDDKKREKARKDAQAFVKKSANQVVEHYGKDTVDSGPLGYLAAHRQALAAHRLQVGQERVQVAAQLAITVARTQGYRQLIADAQACLAPSKKEAHA